MATQGGPIFGAEEEKMSNDSRNMKGSTWIRISTTANIFEIGWAVKIIFLTDRDQ